jgi:Protein of unknown function (DUF2510)
MSTTDTAAQAGWYAVGGGRERYWDGWGWTERVRPVPHHVRVEHRDDLLRRLTAFHASTDVTPN